MITQTAERKTNKGRILRVKPTPRQRAAARIMADIAMGKRKDIKNTGDIVIQAGYAASTKEVPHKILDTSGVKEALSDIGFNPETAKKVVESIMLSTKAKNSDRLKASDMVFKVHGTYAEQRNLNVNIEVDASNPRILELAERLRGTL
jgi:hypothetical protein